MRRFRGICFVEDLLHFLWYRIVRSNTINNTLILPIMETKQAVPSASACMESSFEMRLVAWGMLDELKNEVDTWMT